MVTFQATEQRPVYTRERLGSIPKDTYVANQPFVPNVPPAQVEQEDVFGMVPQLNADGSLKLESHAVELKGAPFCPTQRAAGCGLLSAALAAGIAGSTGGLTGAIPAGVIALAAGAATGALTARGDQVSLGSREESVTTPVMTGYRPAALDSAFMPERPVHWWGDPGGMLHYNVPEIEDRKVGTIQVPEIRHSAMGPEAAAGISAAAGVLVGLAFILL